MPFAAHAKDNRRGSQYGHDDPGCKEIAIPVAAAPKGRLGFHDESRVSRSLRYQSVPLATSFSRYNYLSCKGPQNCRLRGGRNGIKEGNLPRLKNIAQNPQSTCAQSISLLDPRRPTFVLSSGMSKIQTPMQVPVPHNV